MLIKKDKRIKKQIAPQSFVYEYQDKNDKIGMAVSELNGRVPEEGRMRNNVCHEVYYVISGNAKVFIDNNIFEISEGDVLHIEPMKEYYVEASNLKLVIPTNPPFYPEQWENIK